MSKSVRPHTRAVFLGVWKEDPITEHLLIFWFRNLIIFRPTVQAIGRGKLGHQQALDAAIDDGVHRSWTYRPQHGGCATGYLAVRYGQPNDTWTCGPLWDAVLGIFIVRDKLSGCSARVHPADFFHTFDQATAPVSLNCRGLSNLTYRRHDKYGWMVWADNGIPAGRTEDRRWVWAATLRPLIANRWTDFCYIVVTAPMDQMLYCGDLDDW